MKNVEFEDDCVERISEADRVFETALILLKQAYRLKEEEVKKGNNQIILRAEKALEENEILRSKLSRPKGKSTSDLANKMREDVKSNRA